MKRIIVVCLMPFLIAALMSCEGDNTINNVAGSVYGVVTDYATGYPIAYANVSLLPIGETTLTGSDGSYEFLSVPEGSYTISVSKAEYTNSIDNDAIIVTNGSRIRRDLQIKKTLASLRLTDIGGTDITLLDFGNEPSVTSKSFNIFNNGTVSISCSIVYSCKWIKKVSSIPSTISPGQTVNVSVLINRQELSPGNNVTALYVVSNNGSNVINVSATGEGGLPIVLTLPVTYIDGTITPWCNTFHARVTYKGNPAYHSRGFCYSSSNVTPTIEDNPIFIDGTDIGEYSYTYWDFPPYTITYYVRAWVMYGSDNSIQYGNVQSFTFNDVL